MTRRHEVTRRDDTMTKRKWGRFAVVIALMFGLVFALSGVSSAEVRAVDDADEASDILGTVLLDRGIDLGDGPLRDRLEAEVREAIRIGAVSGEILDEFRDRLRERLQEQLRIWAIIAPEWREAFEQVRERVRECRESNDLECWRELRLRLQHEHARRFEEQFENHYQEMQSNGGTADELGELERLRERTQERVESMIQNSSSGDLAGAGLMLGDLEQLRDRLRDQDRIHTSSTSSTSSSTSTSPSTSPATSPATSSPGGPNTSPGGPGSTADEQQSGQGGN